MKYEELSHKYENGQVQYGQCPGYPEKGVSMGGAVSESQVLEVRGEGSEVEYDHIEAGGQVHGDKQD